MASKRGSLLVFGSGPGIGQSVAAVFAERGFERVIVMSRDAKRLEDDAEFARRANGDTTVHAITVDASDPDMVRKTLVHVDEALKGSQLECVLYNAARTGRSELLQFPPESLTTDFHIAVLSLYVVAQWAMPQLLKSASTSQKASAFIATSGVLAKDPYPAMFSLAACKAAQYSLVHSLHKQYESQGVHCALVVVGGTVSADSKVTNPRNIAERTFELCSQAKGEGSVELFLEDPDFAEHVKNREKKK